MTSVKSKPTSKGPLTDKTNVLNMKSNEIVGNWEVDKRRNVPTTSLETPVTKRGRKIRKNVLFNEAVYQIGVPKKYVEKNEEKENIPIQKDSLPNLELTPINEKELFVKVTKMRAKMANTKNGTTNREKISSERIGEAAVVIDESRLNGSPKTVTQVNYNNKTVIGKINNPENDIGTINNKIICGTKELVVKIQDVLVTAHKTLAKNGGKAKKTKAVLNEIICNVDEPMIAKPFRSETNSKSIASKNNIKKTKIKESEVKNKQVEKNTIKSSTKNRIGQKELLIKITPISVTDKNIHKRNLTVPDTGNNEGKKQIEDKAKKAEIIEIKNKAMESSNENIMGKELFVKILNIGNKSNEETKINQKSNLQNHDVLEKPDKPLTFQKELCVKILNIGNKCNEEIKINQKTNLKNHNAPDKPVKTVTFEEAKVKESHNLRNLGPKNYMEESIVDDNLNNENPKEPILTNLQGKNRLPIYRKIILDEPRNNNQSDLYEFVDVSPKTKQIGKRGRPRKSSILFDKNTHEILKRIEEKEVKAKKKAGRKKTKVLKTSSNKLYDKKIKAVIINVKNKISTKNKENPVTINTRNEKPNTLSNNVQGQRNVPYRDCHTKVIQVNSFNDETSIIVHQPFEMPLSQEKSVPHIQNCVSNIENVTSRRNAKVVPSSSNTTNKRNVSAANSAVTNTGTFDKLKESVNAIKVVPSPVLLDCISVCPESDNESNDFDSCTQSQQIVPSHTSHIEANNLSNKTLNGNTQNSAMNKKQNGLKNVTLKRGGRAEIIQSSSVTDKSLLDTFDKLKEPENVIRLVPSSKSIRVPSSRENISIQNDIDSFFGFDNDVPLVVSTPNKAVTKGVVNILGNVLVRQGTEDVESPIDFNVRRPNANSTMIYIGAQDRTSSPWRLDWINVRTNPHFVSIKSNALPRINQEPVLDHTWVDAFESLCSKTPRKGSKTPERRAPIQQSILNFVGATVEKENEPLHVSLFDYDAFNSPVKKTRTGKENENQKVEVVKRNLLGNKGTIISSTPVKRKVLGDISNSSEEQTIINYSSEENTFFGFNESLLPKKTPEKRRNNGGIHGENIENAAKPTRFDLSALRSYTAKNKKKKVTIAEEEQEAIQIPDESISLVEVSNEENVGETINLFEEPEQTLENMTSPHITKKKPRRKRLDSCASDTEENEKKRKRHKKTKFEIEQEEWIEQFNKMCGEIDQHELELN